MKSLLESVIRAVLTTSRPGDSQTPQLIRVLIDWTVSILLIGHHDVVATLLDALIDAISGNHGLR
jgi:hypothetical protein